MPMRMVTITHRGTGPDDIVEVTGEDRQEAVALLLEKRGVKTLIELEPAVIETRWC